jgi:hypothetical protein
VENRGAAGQPGSTVTRTPVPQVAAKQAELVDERLDAP